jgi:hypothetical protein
MYAGHAAVALALKAREPRVPAAVLVVACFGPDWVELFMSLSLGRGPAEAYSHFIPAVILGALAAGALYAIVSRGRPGAVYVVIGWLLHWPADFFTAHKPLLNPEHVIGLDLYNLPLVDFAIEAALVAGCCVLYARAYARSVTQQRWVAAMGLALAGLQGVLDYGLLHQGWRVWQPSLAVRGWRPHRFPPASGARELPIRMRLAFSSGISHSERAMAKDGPRGIITLVCLTCGKEKFFTQEVPAAVSCEQCGGTVFRSFMTPTEPDEAAIDAAEMQARSMAYGDSSPDTSADDLRDLDAR